MALSGQTIRCLLDELDGAVDWIRKRPDFEEKRLVLKDVVGRLGHEDLAYYI